MLNTNYKYFIFYQLVARLAHHEPANYEPTERQRSSSRLEDVANRVDSNGQTANNVYSTPTPSTPRPVILAVPDQQQQMQASKTSEMEVMHKIESMLKQQQENMFKQHENVIKDQLANLVKQQVSQITREHLSSQGNQQNRGEETSRRDMDSMPSGSSKSERQRLSEEKPSLMASQDFLPTAQESEDKMTRLMLEEAVSQELPSLPSSLEDQPFHSHASLGSPLSSASMFAPKSFPIPAPHHFQYPSPYGPRPSMPSFGPGYGPKFGGSFFPPGMPAMRPMRPMPIGPYARPFVPPSPYSPFAAPSSISPTRYPAPPSMGPPSLHSLASSMYPSFYGSNARSSGSSSPITIGTSAMIPKGGVEEEKKDSKGKKIKGMLMDFAVSSILDVGMTNLMGNLFGKINAEPGTY